MFIKLINRYLIKSFLTRFLQILVACFFLGSLIGLIEIFEKAREANLSIFKTLLLSVISSVGFVDEFSSSIILLSAIITLFTLASKSEITAIRNSSFSLWDIIEPIALTSFFIGILWITLFASLNGFAINKLRELENVGLKKESKNIIEFSGGVWIKQANLENQNEEILIKMEKVDPQNLSFINVSFWFFDEDGIFYKKIDAKEVFFKQNQWLVKDAIINGSDLTNKKSLQTNIKTNIQESFINNIIRNNFQDVKLFTIFELPQIIKELNNEGISSLKFRVRYHHLLTRPLMFAIMSIIAGFFAINHIRNQKAFIMIFLGVLTGVGLYIFDNIAVTLGSAGLISVISASWIMAMIYLSIAILLIFYKEKF
jgi:lipopolysaccharide export system permease protein